MVFLPAADPPQSHGKRPHASPSAMRWEAFRTRLSYNPPCGRSRIAATAAVTTTAIIETRSRVVGGQITGAEERTLR